MYIYIYMFIEDDNDILDINYYNGKIKKYNNKNYIINEWEILPEDLIIYKNKILGQGSFGKVYLGLFRKTKVAVKVINNINDNFKNLFIKEFKMMTKLHHPNVIQLIGFVRDPFIVVMEYLPKGNLLNYIIQNKLSYKKKIKICIQILQALCYIHNRKPKYIIHRDIKPQNILLTKSLDIKLSDFGISRIFSYNNLHKLDIEDKKNILLTQPVGSKRYMAPEISLKNNFYNYTIDIWSAGILFYELFENKRYNNILVWCKTNKNIKNIILKMLNKDKNKRPSADILINDFNIELLKINKCNII